MNKCTNCGKDFVDPKALTCKFCGTNNPQNKREEPTKIVDEGTNTISEDKNEPEHENEIEQSIHPSEKTLNIIANLILTFGIIAFFIIIYISDIEYNPKGLVIPIITLLSSIITSAVFKVIIQISINTRRTKEYLKEIYNNKKK